MQFRKLGATGIEIAPLVLGGNVFGWTADKAASFAILDAFMDAGFNAIDTADVYSLFVPGHKAAKRDRDRRMDAGARQPRQGGADHQGRAGDGPRAGRA